MTSKIDLSVVQALRGKTGAGIGMCMEVLKETAGNIEEAEELLKKRGILKASKKQGNDTNHGVVAITTNEHYKTYEKAKKIAVLELHCETDFLAKNTQFVELADKLVSILLSYGKNDLDGFLGYKSTTTGNATVEEMITENIAVFGENVKIRSVKVIDLQESIISSFYVHNKSSDQVGSIVSSISIKTDKKLNAEQISTIQSFAKSLSMHIAAYKPKMLNKEDVTAEDIKKTTDLVQEKYDAGDFQKNGKNVVAADVIIKNELNKMYKEFALLEQAFLLDSKKSVKDVIEGYQKDMGITITLQDMVRVAPGE